MNSKKIIQLLALAFIFIVLPAGSWYYLNEGYKYRKAVLEELDQNLGSIPNFKLKNQFGKWVDHSIIDGKVTIINSLSLKNGVNAPLMEQIFKVQDQFDKRDDIAFLTLTEANTENEVSDYFKNLNIKRNKNQWHFLTGTNTELLSIAENAALPIKTSDDLAKGFVAITDTASVVRYTYDFEDPNAVKKLIEHIANLMPREENKRQLRKEN